MSRSVARPFSSYALVACAGLCAPAIAQVGKAAPEPVQPPSQVDEWLASPGGSTAVPDDLDTTQATPEEVVEQELGPAGSDGPAFDMAWFTIDGGGATYLTGGGFELGGTTGQSDAGLLAGGAFELGGGFWQGVDAFNTCYANCDGSTVPPVLNALDFSCFLNRFTQGQALPLAQQIPSYGNCDGSTIPPVLNALDFSCYLGRYLAGCP